MLDILPNFFNTISFLLKKSCVFAFVLAKEISIKELAEMIVEITGYKNDYEWDTSKPNGTPRKVLNVDKVKSLGWKPKISLREGLESTYEWMKNNRSNLRIYNRSELDYGN